MPANEIMQLYRAGKLHSGSTGKVVNKKSQAKAILISYARKEGHQIPEKK
jgi:ribosomal protein L21E